MKNEAADASITFEEIVIVMINKEIGSPRVAIYILDVVELANSVPCATLHDTGNATQNV